MYLMHIVGGRYGIMPALHCKQALCGAAVDLKRLQVMPDDAT
jgi:hypothetical protein